MSSEEPIWIRIQMHSDETGRTQRNPSPSGRDWTNSDEPILIQMKLDELKGTHRHPDETGRTQRSLY